MLKLSKSPVFDTVAKMAVVAALMFAFVFVVMVPLYNVLCQALGINGKGSGVAYTATSTAVDESRTVKIQFVATHNEGMPWDFRPGETVMRVHPGAVNNTAFYARNPLDKTMTAQAIPSFSPAEAAEYFHKTECFCFSQQTLEGKTEANLPVQYIVDQDLPAYIKTITLSYTIFDVTDMVKAPIAAR